VTAPLRAALVVLAFVSLTAGALAQPSPSIDPPAPTPDDEVVLRVVRTCQVNLQTVTRTGTEISVVLRQTSSCPSPPLDLEHRVVLGKLPAGEYRVTLSEYSDLPPRIVPFTVFEANPFLAVRPFVVPVDTPGFPIELVFRDEDPGVCCDSVVEIGGVEYRASDMLPREGTWFHAPDLPPGLHDIRIIKSDGAIIAVPAALYYQAPGAAADPGVFERVLFPVLFRSGGRNGSQWRSEAVVSNPTDYQILMANTIVPQAQLLAPKKRYAFSGEQHPTGVALLVPRREAQDVAFQLRIRDISREGDSFGTEVPVVRESEMFRGENEITLLDVPLDPRYRTKLRVYFLPDAGADDLAYVNVKVVPAAGGAPSFLFTLLSRECSGVACASTPYYGELDLAAAGNGARADLYVDTIVGGAVWAFASVTNNETQAVTLVTPDGRGGRP
jgi:hypothetical protein